MMIAKITVTHRIEIGTKVSDKTASVEINVPFRDIESELEKASRALFSSLKHDSLVQPSV